MKRKGFPFTPQLNINRNKNMLKPKFVYCYVNDYDFCTGFTAILTSEGAEGLARAKTKDDT